MAWTKGDLVNAAFGELALVSGPGFDVTPEETARALLRLDAMVATWAAKGVRIGYAFPASPQGSKATDASGIPDAAAETVFLNLAKRLAPSFGKALSPQTLTAAREGYDTLLWSAARPPEQQLPNTQPRGAGNKPWRTANRPFLPRPDSDPLRFDGQSGELDILQE